MVAAITGEWKLASEDRVVGSHGSSKMFVCNRQVTPERSPGDRCSRSLSSHSFLSSSPVLSKNHASKGESVVVYALSGNACKDRIAMRNNKMLVCDIM